jgi:hypothetical protein
MTGYERTEQNGLTDRLKNELSNVLKERAVD